MKTLATESGQRAGEPGINSVRVPARHRAVRAHKHKCVQTQTGMMDRSQQGAGNMRVYALVYAQTLTYMALCLEPLITL